MRRARNTRPPRRGPVASRLTVVGVGASAGGLEAFTRLLEQLPAKVGTAFVFVQHLDPTHESYLPELLSRATKMPVKEIRDGTIVKPDCVYVMPSNVRMSMNGKALRLRPRQDVAGANLPIDEFFRSLAENSLCLAIGVVLSGAGSDGTQGLKAIKFSGGVTFAQDPTSAKHDGMPSSAIMSGCVDFVLPPDLIAKELIKVGNHPLWISTPRLRKGSDVVESSGQLDTILGMVHAATGADFTDYRRTTIQRRIERRLILHKIDGLDGYLRFIKKNPAEVDALFQDILIHVTSFFREPELFAYLKSKVFPILVKNRGRKDPIRIWVPGCSTGEEAYSIAMALHEFQQGKTNKFEMQIFASDISEPAIEQARTGLYPENIMADVSRERLRNYFVKVDQHHQINKSIRDCCIFAKQDVAKDPPFSRLDLVSCRNVLIYLGPELQKKVIPIFHYALKPDSFLVLGAAESIGRYSGMFQFFDKHHRIYQKKQLSHPIHYMGDGEAKVPADREPRKRAVAKKDEQAFFDAPRDADRILLSRYAPASILVDDQMDILQFRGHTGRFLEPSPGTASLNLMKMARRGLWSDLRLAIQKARKDGTTVRKEGLRAEFSDETRNIDIEVIPMRRSDAKPHAFLVLFTEKDHPSRDGKARRAAPVSKMSARDERLELQRLTEELEATREYLQAVIEMQQATNEEMKTANEEILSSNEELQSTNEELETTKEELQSTNEELITVNDELRGRNTDAAQALSDLNNVLNSAGIPLVLLARDLTIRRTNTFSEELLNLRATDIGRSLRETRLTSEMAKLEALIQEVLKKVATREMKITAPNGHTCLLRVRPYRNADNQVDGAVLMAIDLDEQRKRTRVE